MGATLEDISEFGLTGQHFLILLGIAGMTFLPTFFTKKNDDKTEKVKGD